MRSKKVISQENFTKGIVRDISGLIAPESSLKEAVNVRLFQHIVKPAEGTHDASFVLGTLEGKPLDIANFFTHMETRHLMCVTSSNLYRYNVATKSFEVVAPYPGSPDRTVCSTMFMNLMIFTDRENPIKKFDGFVCSDLGGNPPLAKHVQGFWSHLILADTIEDWFPLRNRIRWSDTGNPEVWTSGNAGFVDIVDTPGEVTALSVLGDRCFVFQKESIYELVYVGYPDMFTIARVATGVGAVGPKAVVNIGQALIFKGEDNIYVFDGTSIQSIGDSIKPWLYGTHSQLDPEHIRNAMVSYVKALNEVWIWTKSTEAEFPTWIFRYNIPTQSWWLRKYKRDVYCTGVWKREDTVMWSDLGGTWTDQTWRWSDPTVAAGFEVFIFGTFEAGLGKIKQLDLTSSLDDGVYPIDSYIVMQERGTPLAARWVEVRAEVEGTGMATLYISDGNEASFHEVGSVSGAGSWSWVKWTFDLSSTVVLFKIKLSNLSLRRVEVFYSPKVREVHSSV